MSFLGAIDTAIGKQNWGNALQGGAGVVGGVSSIVGGFIQAGQMRDFANYAQDLGEHNAEVALSTAEAEVQKIRYDTRQKLAVLRSELVGSGVQMSGTPLALYAQQAAQARYQAMLARYGGKVNAQQARFAGDTQAYQYRTNATAAEIGGIAGGLSGFGQATGSLLQIEPQKPKYEWPGGMLA